MIKRPLIKNSNKQPRFWLKIGGSTPLYLAACNGHIEIVKFLVPLTDNPNTKDVYGRTPMCLVAEEGHTEIVKYLEDTM